MRKFRPRLEKKLDEMGTRFIHCLIFLLLGFLLCSGSCSGLSVTEKPLVEPIESKKLDHEEKQLLPSAVSHRELIGDESKYSTTQMDVTTPITTVPVINPMTPATTTPVIDPYTTPEAPTITTPITTPTTAFPVSSGGSGSWCVASQTASQTALQVALDYACGYGGADCSPIQSSGSCYNPNTVRDHASYAFNDYYQKNPVPTSCNFGGTAVITSTDPSSGSCQYPSTSTSSSVLNTTNPTGSAVYGSEPSGSNNSAASASQHLLLLITSTCLLVSLLAVKRF